MDSLHWLLLALAIAFALRSFWLSLTVEVMQEENEQLADMLKRVLEKCTGATP